MSKYSNLRLCEREQAAAMLANGQSKAIIAREFGRSRAAIDRELKRSVLRSKRCRRAQGFVEHGQINHILMSMLESDFLRHASHLGWPLPDYSRRNIDMRKGPLILIVDDDREIVRGLNIRFKSNGYEIATAYDGREGLDTALKARPDAIILDILMPGMDGLTMLSRLRGYERTSTIPTVVLSGKIGDRTKTEALDLGASCCLDKPCEAGVLLQAVQSAMSPVQPDRATLH